MNWADRSQGENKRRSPFLRGLPFFTLCLTACQPLPHPFADDTPPRGSSILRPPDAAGILVGSITGVPSDSAAVLQDAFADALRTADVPASTTSENHASYRLSATVAPSGQAGRAVLHWVLRNADGGIVGHDSLLMTLPVGTGAPIMARQAAPEIAKLIQGGAPSPIAGLDPVVTLAEVQGAPGDGNRSLASAMADFLSHAHLVVTTAANGKESYRLTCDVSVSPADPGKQQIAVRWTVSRPDGQSLGQVQQQNALPAGSLDGPWGDVAFAVANAAGPGILAIIEHAKMAAAGS